MANLHDRHLEMNTHPMTDQRYLSHRMSKRIETISTMVK